MRLSFFHWGLAGRAGLCLAVGQEKAPTRESSKANVVDAPTPHDVVLKMLDLARRGQGRRGVRPGVRRRADCGPGGQDPRCRGKGYDIDPQRIKECHENAKTYGVEKLVEFQQKDIFEVDLSGASVVTLYLLPNLNVRLIPQLEKMKPARGSSRTISTCRA